MNFVYKSKIGFILSFLYFLLIIIIGIMQIPYCPDFEGMICQFFDFYPLVPLIYFIPHRFWYIAALFNIILIYVIVILIKNIFRKIRKNI